MKRAWIVITAGLVLCSFGLGRATTSVSFDSTWWNTMTRSDQVEVVTGELDGYEIGYVHAYFVGELNGVKRELALFDRVNSKFFVGARQKDILAYKALLGYETMQVAQHDSDSPPMPHFPDSFGTYLDNVTHFYENNPNKSDWSPAQVLSCYSGVAIDDCQRVQL